MTVAWVRLDDSFYTNPKFSGLSHGAFRLYVVALSWSAANLTDGYIAARDLGPISAHIGRRVVPNRAEELARHGLWEPRENGAYVIHDFLRYNKSREQVERDRERWRRAWVKRGDSTAESEGDSAVESEGPPRAPVPSRPLSLKNASSLQIDGDRTSDDDGSICSTCKGDAEAEADRHDDIRNRSAWVMARAIRLHRDGACQSRIGVDGAPRQPRRFYELIDPDELMRNATQRIVNVETTGEVL